VTEESPPYDAGWDPWSVPTMRRKTATTMTADEYQETETEAEFMATVREAAHRLGWVTVHFPNALCNPSGWPDLLMFKDGGVLIAELKTGTGKLGPKQWEWIGTLAGVGIDVRIWTPDMWDDQIVPALQGTE
jgi:hypothetical protein